MKQSVLTGLALGALAITQPLHGQTLETLTKASAPARTLTQNTVLTFPSPLGIAFGHSVTTSPDQEPAHTIALKGSIGNTAAQAYTDGNKNHELKLMQTGLPYNSRITVGATHEEKQNDWYAGIILNHLGAVRQNGIGLSGGAFMTGEEGLGVNGSVSYDLNQDRVAWLGYTKQGDLHKFFLGMPSNNGWAWRLSNSRKEGAKSWTRDLKIITNSSADYYSMSQNDSWFALADDRNGGNKPLNSNLANPHGYLPLPLAHQMSGGAGLRATYAPGEVDRTRIAGVLFFSEEGYVTGGAQFENQDLTVGELGFGLSTSHTKVQVDFGIPFGKNQSYARLTFRRKP